jgi:signal peptidase I
MNGIESDKASPLSSRTGSAASVTNQEIEPSEASQFLSFVRTLTFIIVAVVFLRSSVVEAFKIPSGSMIPTLKVGDHIFVWKFSYGLRLPLRQKMLWRYSAPARGDIVVFTRPDDPATLEDESDTNIIKRVIGLPGDTVEVRKDRVFINNRLHDESYARWEEEGIREGDFGPETVPPDHLFLLGDNRDRSRDSRFWEGAHYLPIDNVKGKAFIIYWSWDSLSRIGTIIR